MSLDYFKIEAALIIFIITILGGIWPFIKRRWHFLNQGHISTLDFPLGESLSTGIFFGAGLLHMLPDAARDFNKEGYNYPFAFLIAASSFMLLLFIEHLSVALERKSSHISQSSHSKQLLNSIALLTMVMLSIHSLFEGTAIGVAQSFITTIIIFIAIVAHKSAASFALAIKLNQSSLSFTKQILGFTLFAIMTPTGIFLGDWLLIATQHVVLLTPIFTALAAGTFIYIGTLHGLERANLIAHCCNLKEFSAMILGFLLMAIIAIWT